MSIRTATFSQWYQALELVFAKDGITIERIDKDKLREKYYNHDFTPHQAKQEILNSQLKRSAA